MRALLAVTLVALAVSGCASSPPSAAPSSTSQAPSTSTAPPPPVLLTDTLHLMAAPHLQAMPPTGPDVIRTPVPGYADQFSGILLAQSPRAGLFWDMPRPDLTVLEGNATLWVEVQGTVTNLQTSGCFWQVYLRIDSPDGGFSASSGPCLVEGPVVAPGVRRLFAEFGSLDLRPVAGDTLSLWVFSNGGYAPGATVEVLSGTPEFASTLSLRGLALPLDTVTFLH